MPLTTDDLSLQQYGRLVKGKWLDLCSKPIFGRLQMLIPTVFVHGGDPSTSGCSCLVSIFDFNRPELSVLFITWSFSPNPAISCICCSKSAVELSLPEGRLRRRAGKQERGTEGLLLTDWLVGQFPKAAQKGANQSGQHSEVWTHYPVLQDVRNWAHTEGVSLRVTWWADTSYCNEKGSHKPVMFSHKPINSHIAEAWELGRQVETPGAVCKFHGLIPQRTWGFCRVRAQDLLSQGVQPCCQLS